mmetsp:Transcript_877/g.1624  ORF Transcript_877/g.1624 Transcript_877/m.1624 type:complete len:106 (-) Transcript_877:1918-2235(-)
MMVAAKICSSLVFYRTTTHVQENNQKQYHPPISKPPIGMHIERHRRGKLMTRSNRVDWIVGVATTQPLLRLTSCGFTDVKVRMAFRPSNTCVTCLRVKFDRVRSS